VRMFPLSTKNDLQACRTLDFVALLDDALRRQAEERDAAATAPVRPSKAQANHKPLGLQPVALTGSARWLLVVARQVVDDCERKGDLKILQGNLKKKNADTFWRTTAIHLLADRTQEALPFLYSQAEVRDDQAALFAAVEATGQPVLHEDGTTTRTGTPQPFRGFTRTPLRRSDQTGNLFVDDRLLAYLDGSGALTAPQWNDLQKVVAEDRHEDHKTQKAAVVAAWSVCLSSLVSPEEARRPVFAGLPKMLLDGGSVHIQTAPPDFLQVTDAGELVAVARERTGVHDVSQATAQAFLNGLQPVDAGRLRTFVEAVWSKVVRRELRDIQNGSTAVVFTDRRATSDALTGSRLSRQTALGDGTGTALAVLREGRVVGNLVAEVPNNLNLFAVGFPALMTPDGIRLRKALSRHAQTARDLNETDWRVVSATSLQELAAKLQLKDTKDTKTLVAMLVTGGSLFVGENFGHTLWSLNWSGFDLLAGGRGRRPDGAIVAVTVSPLLAPSREEVGRRTMIPDLRHEVPVGNLSNALQGAAMMLGDRVVENFVLQNQEAAQNEGAVFIPTNKVRGRSPSDRQRTRSWQELCLASAGDRQVAEELFSQLPQILHEFTDTQTGTPLLERDGDQFRLAKPHAPELAFIVDGGNRSLQAGAEQGREKKAARTHKGRK